MSRLCGGEGLDKCHPCAMMTLPIGASFPMSQLKPSFLKDIQSALTKSCFSATDFSLEFPEARRALVRITFTHKPEWCLTLFEDESKRTQSVDAVASAPDAVHRNSCHENVRPKVYTVRMVPGTFKTESVVEIADPGEMLSLLPKWCEGIRADLYAGAVTEDPVENMRRELDADLLELIDAPDAMFSEKELEIIDLRFDRLQGDISALLESDAVDANELEVIESAIDEFKRSARAYPKGVWARVTNNKLAGVTGPVVRTPQGRALLYQEIRLALGVGKPVALKRIGQRGGAYLEHGTVRVLPTKAK